MVRLLLRHSRCPNLSSPASTPPVVPSVSSSAHQPAVAQAPNALRQPKLLVADEVNSDTPPASLTKRKRASDDLSDEEREGRKLRLTEPEVTPDPILVDNESLSSVVTPQSAPEQHAEEATAARAVVASDSGSAETAETDVLTDVYRAVVADSSDWERGPEGFAKWPAHLAKQINESEFSPFSFSRGPKPGTKPTINISEFEDGEADPVWEARPGASEYLVSEMR